MQKQKIAMVDALESFQKQGMASDAQARMMKQMGGNLKDTQNDLNYRRNYRKKQANIAPTPVKIKPITPTPKPAPKIYVPAGGGMHGRRGPTGRSRGTRIPSIPAGKDVRKTANQLNIK